MIKHRVNRRRAIALLAAWSAQARDFPALSSAADRRAFRLWFCWLAEVLSYQHPRRRPPEVTDCSSLLRFAFREALRRHDAAWANSLGLDSAPSFPDVARAPFTALFETVSGQMRHFADAAQLMRHNTFLIGRDPSLAQPADLLFYRQLHDKETWHAMIHLGPSLIEQDSGPFVLYHTGPTGLDPGEILRPSFNQLLHHREPRWRPLAGNSNFLGIHRWNILRESW